MAKIISTTAIDCILVGDSVAMVMHGYKTTLNATVDMMVLHTAAVARGAPNKFIVADLPFLSYRKGLKAAMDAITVLMQAGAHAVKIERVEGNENLIRHIVDSGVPVMGHIGLTPQSVHQLSGYKVQGRTEIAAVNLLKQAKVLEDVGCFAIVLECIPRLLAGDITSDLSIPTIGIGAGENVSGQVLVIHDLLGFYQDIQPKFVKNYLNGYELVQNSLNAYVNEINAGEFPLLQHSFNSGQSS
ncbi:MAG: 3-methyl-2-oxobutanoate hydroxymethyltransferase [Legionellaceae bacterium]